MFNNFPKVAKLLILIPIAAIGYFVYRFDLVSYLSLESLQANGEWLREQVANRYIVAALLFILAYIAAVSLSLPGASLISLLGGYLFGLIGTVYVIIGATLGATILFYISRFLLGDWVQKKFGKRLETFNKEIEEDGANYLFSIRLMPIFPFWLVNLLSGITKINIKGFLWATALGILPGSFVYVFVGRSLQEIESLADIFSPYVIAGLVLFALLGLIPIAIKKYKKRQVA